MNTLILNNLSHVRLIAPRDGPAESRSVRVQCHTATLRLEGPDRCVKFWKMYRPVSQMIENDETADPLLIHSIDLRDVDTRWMRLVDPCGPDGDGVRWELRIHNRTVMEFHPPISGIAGPIWIDRPGGSPSQQDRRLLLHLKRNHELNASCATRGSVPWKLCMRMVRDMQKMISGIERGRDMRPSSSNRAGTQETT